MNKKSTANQEKADKTEAPVTRPYFVPGVGTVEASDLADLEDKVKNKKEVGDATN
ncbi:hypothetical protein [uncultured Kocuria sp.]|uniref:hypothetical protein n=1 Tax=uncultured Kocuria sp. TaxID=259305 RepID=UPI002609108E|nr:hypothetical protein [uncultured Kocuria sp.]